MHSGKVCRVDSRDAAAMHGDVSFHGDNSGKTPPRKPTQSFLPPQNWGVPSAPDLPTHLLSVS